MVKTDVNPDVSFARKLASAARVLDNEHPAAKDPYRALSELRAGEGLTKWLIFGLVGTGDSFIHSGWTDAQVLQAIKEAGEIHGLAGVCVIGETHVATYVRPFLKGKQAVKYITKVAEAEKALLLAAMREAAKQAGKK